VQERRKYPSFDLPVTVRLSQQHVVAAKMVELSMGGMRFLCPIAPEINSEVELRFSPPSEHTHELRLMANVRHSFEVHAPPEYRYAVGVVFMNPQEHVRVMLDKFFMELCLLSSTLAN
jgi:hypothetical protein